MTTTLQIPAHPVAQRLEYDAWVQGEKVEWIDEVFKMLDRIHDTTYLKYKVRLEPVTKGDWEIKRDDIGRREWARLYYVVNGGSAGQIALNRDCGYGDTTRLMGPDDDQIVTWMSDTRAEIMEHSPLLNTLWWLERSEKPRVLVNGLGIGMAVRAALNHGASHVDVVEINEHVIDLVAPNFADDPVTIHHADAHEIRWPVGARWDLAWHDIWPFISAANLPEMDRLHRRYNRRVRWQASWQRAECLRLRRESKKLTAALERGDWAAAKQIAPLL